MLVQLKVDFHRFPDQQFTLHQRAHAALAYVQADASCRPDSSRDQVTEGDWDTGQNSRVSPHGELPFWTPLPA